MPIAAAMATDAAVSVAASLFVDVVSDVVCPWCYIGKRKLEAAVARLRAASCPQATVRWHAFELNPDLPAQGVARAPYLESKFGGKARANEIYERVRAAGAEVGIAFAFDRIERQPNTRDAHRLIAWAQQRGDANALVERLFRAYFTEGLYLGDIDLLVALAAEVGLPTNESRAMLVADDYRAEVQAEYREALEAGISGVPFFIFNGRTAVSGAHDPHTLLEAMAAARAGA